MEDDTICLQIRFGSLYNLTLSIANLDDGNEL
jgi:hypothetical protein